MSTTAIHRASCGMLVHAGKVLLVHRSPQKSWFPNVWDFPGGHLEPGETSVQALVRELQEELSVEVTPPRGVPLITFRQPGVVLDIWRVEAWHGDVTNAAPHEHDDIGWFTPNEAKKLDLADHEYRALFDQEVS